MTEQRFDPYATLEALEGRGVAYVLIGAFARVVQGTEEITHGLDLAPSLHGDNPKRLALALDDLEAVARRRQADRARRGDDRQRAGDASSEPAAGRSRSSRTPPAPAAATTTSAEPPPANHSAEASDHSSHRSATSPAWPPPSAASKT